MVLQTTREEILPQIAHHRWRKPITFSAITAALLILFIYLNATITPQQLEHSQGLTSLVLLTSLLNFLFITETAIKLAMLHPKVRRHTSILGMVIIVWILLVRAISSRFGFPALLYQTSFFSSPYTSIFGYTTSVGKMTVNVAILLYLTMYAIRYISVHQFNHQGLKRVFVITVFSLITCIAYGLFIIIASFIGNVVIHTDYLIAPNKISLFKANSYFLISNIFCYYFCFALLIHKIVRQLTYAVQRSIGRSVRFLAINFAIVAVVTICFWPTTNGIPMWLILTLLAIYMLLGMATIRYAKKNFRFTSILVKIFFFTFCVSLFLSICTPIRENIQRKQFISHILINSSDSSGSQMRGQESTYRPDSKQILNRQYIRENSKITLQYSFGYYRDGKLVDQVGKYDYKLTNREYLQKESVEGEAIQQRGYVHYIYHLDDRRVLVVGEKRHTLYDFIASLSFFFIFFLFCYFFCCFCIRVFSSPAFKRSLYSDLLWISLAVLMVIVISTCVISLTVFAQQTESEQKESIHVTTSRVQLALMRDDVFLNHISETAKRDSLNLLLQELDRIYNVRIKLYDLSGKMVGSSTPNTYSKNELLPSEVMKHFKQSFTYYYDKEKTESDIMCELYKVVLNDTGEPMAYLSTCNVKNRNMLRKEMSEIVTAFLHDCTLLILLAVFAAWLVYAVVSAYMKKIGKAMSKRRGRRSPLRINWVESEEIGQLICEHNRMVEEIHQQADLLAKSERETAWREMALEIAHEIKNPLTPMKLKMQMLQHAWHSGKEDFPRKMADTSEQILKQIDSLKEVADTFSEFASTQQSVNKDENLCEVMDEIRDSLASTPVTSYNFQYDKTSFYYASFDRKLFVQMVQNLVKNADRNRNADGRLNINITLGEAPTDSRYWLLTFASDDRGLDAKDPELAFTVKFSADNCGHSLCLPIVKNIVSGFAGDISFVTSDKGSTFYIRIPKL